MMWSRQAKLLAIAYLFAGSSAGLAQQPDAGEREVLAVAAEALRAVTAEDAVALTDLMVDEAIIFTVSGQSNDSRHSIRSRLELRRRGFTGDIIERGFDPEVRVASGLATVWLPYDLYVDGAWSHCGVDVFSLLRVEGRWKIVTMGWTVEQPPACRRHPAGPPPA